MEMGGEVNVSSALITCEIPLETSEYLSEVGILPEASIDRCSLNVYLWKSVDVLNPFVSRTCSMCKLHRAKNKLRGKSMMHLYAQMWTSTLSTPIIIV
jgi:hypothetical protein